MLIVKTQFPLQNCLSVFKQNLETAVLVYYMSVCYLSLVSASMLLQLERDFWGFLYFFRTIFQHCFICRPLRFHCADGCWEWDRTQDRCNWCIGSQTL
jgi:hypothetical protein